MATKACEVAPSPLDNGLHFSPHLACFAHFCLLPSPWKHLSLLPVLFIKAHLNLDAVFLTNTLNVEPED